MPRVPIALALALAIARISACATPGAAPAAAPPAPALESAPANAGQGLATPPPGTARAAPESAGEPPHDLALPLGWSTLAPAAFEEALARWNAGARPGRLDPAALDDLSRALDGPVPGALRAVLLLAASSAPEAEAVLRARLERRLRSATAEFPAVDVAAAAALGRLPRAGSARLAAALDELAQGRRPHPYLVVRAECAASSLALGREESAAFLLALLVEGTASQGPRPPWARGATPIEELAFAQWRASDALARQAGIRNPYRPEAAATERARAAAEIERALAQRAEESRGP